MESKPCAASAIEDYVYRIFPNDLNNQGKVFGGLVMSLLDKTALVCAERHSQRSCVTASVDALHFLAPAERGDNLIIKATINRTWTSSMEVGLKVIAENPKTGKRVHVVSAYFTFVAIDADGKPIPICSVTPETQDQKRRFEEAEVRRQARIRLAEERKKLRRKEY